MNACSLSLPERSVKSPVIVFHLDKSSKLKQAANNVIKSRHLARTHYKSDSDVGKKLGAAMYEHIKDKI